MLVIRGANIRGGAYIRDFTVCHKLCANLLVLDIFLSVFASRWSKVFKTLVEIVR